MIVPTAYKANEIMKEYGRRFINNQAFMNDPNHGNGWSVKQMQKTKKKEGYLIEVVMSDGPNYRLMTLDKFLITCNIIFDYEKYGLNPPS